MVTPGGCSDRGRHGRPAGAAQRGRGQRDPPPGCVSQRPRVGTPAPSAGTASSAAAHRWAALPGARACSRGFSTSHPAQATSLPRAACQEQIPPILNQPPLAVATDPRAQ